jgi:leader peptidase (prepilin peptidase)/N-methyltransferase
LTGLVFAALFYFYFYTDLRAGIGSFSGGGWFIYLISIILLSALIAASAIDLELWIIPLSVCWFGTAVGLVGSALGVYIIDPDVIRSHAILPFGSAKTSAMAAGAAIGLAVSSGLLAAGLIKRSYVDPHEDAKAGTCEQTEAEVNLITNGESQIINHQLRFNHRLEACKEIIFLLPIIICSLAAYWICQNALPIRDWWADFSQHSFVAGLLGSLWGYFVGCGVVWATRILGTLAFGKEAMGLGDVHLMGAAGAVIGPVFVVVAFLIAPFFGLAWAGFQMFFKKIRQIPYGPFLSLGIFAVMILHDWILDYLQFMFCR